MASELFKEYYKKLRNEGILRSLIYGLIAGFSVAFVLGLIFWATGFKLWWLCLIALPAVCAVVAVVCYFKKFRPTTKSIAKRVDALGLEERILTMTELENDDSYIAMRQREDAQAALAGVNKSLLKFTLSIPLIVMLAIVPLVGTTMVTVSALSAYGVIRSGSDISNGSNREEKEFKLTYEVDGEGEIEGESFQIVAEGDDGTPVFAVADEGWVFVGWSDGVESPYRQDIEVSKDITVKAYFEEVYDDGDEDDGEGEDPDGEGSGHRPAQSNQPSEQNPQGGKFESYNQVYNGQTYYGEIYNESYNDALEDSEGLPEEEREAIGNYFGTIAK